MQELHLEWVEKCTINMYSSIKNANKTYKAEDVGLKKFIVGKFRFQDN